MKTKTQKKSITKGRKLPGKPKAKVNSTGLAQKKSSQSQTKEVSLGRTRYPEIKIFDRLNIIAEHWLSDAQFFKDEIRFLRNLISKYFVWLTEDENIKSTKEIARDLSSLEKQRESIEQKIHQHIHTYRNLFENPFSHDRNQFKREHAQLEKEMTELVNVFRGVKQKTFTLTESVIQSEKVKHLLSNQGETES